MLKYAFNTRHCLFFIYYIPHISDKYHGLCSFPSYNVLGYPDKEEIGNGK